MFNTLGLETPPWLTEIHTFNAMVLPNKQKDKKPTSAGMFAPTSPPACLKQFDLITIPGHSTLSVAQIATSLVGFSWFVPLKMNLRGWSLCLHLPWEQNPDLVSGPRHLARSIAYSFIGVRRCHPDPPHYIRYLSFCRSLTRKGLEPVD